MPRRRKALHHRLEGLARHAQRFLWPASTPSSPWLLVLVFDFGSVKHTLVALLPLAMQ